jgi:hypothetical protein
MESLIAQFYDNDIRHISNFQWNFPKIESILVDDTIPNQRLNVKSYTEYLALPGISRTKIYPKSFDKTNKYAQYKIDIGQNAMPSCGITDNTIQNIIETYQYPAKYKYIFFDWDKTLTGLEDFASPLMGYKYGKHILNSYYDIMEYLIGTKEKINLYKKMYKSLIKNNTKVFILTNNKIASKINNVGNRKEFLQLIEIIFPNFPEDHLISGYDYEYNKVDALKGTILNDGTKLDDVCNNLFMQNKPLKIKSVKKLNK